MKKSNNGPPKVKRHGEAPESFVRMMEIVNRVCNRQDKEQKRKHAPVSELPSKQ